MRTNKRFPPCGNLLNMNVCIDSYVNAEWLYSNFMCPHVKSYVPNVVKKDNQLFLSDNNEFQYC